MTREELYDDAKNNLETAEKRVASLKEASSRALAALDGKPGAPAEAHPRYQQALAMLETAKLDLKRTRVTAPVTAIFGLKDRIIPWQHAAQLPARTAVHFFRNAGHMPHWAAPDLVAGLLLR